MLLKCKIGVKISCFQANNLVLPQIRQKGNAGNVEYHSAISDKYSCRMIYQCLGKEVYKIKKVYFSNYVDIIRRNVRYEHVYVLASVPTHLTLPKVVRPIKTAENYVENSTGQGKVLKIASVRERIFSLDVRTDTRKGDTKAR